MVIIICAIWAFSVLGLGRKFTALVASKEAEKAAEEKALRELQSTNAYKFKNNLESRIYAQLSKQISDKLFGEGASTGDSDWIYTPTPFGDTIGWKREGDRIYINVKNSNNDTVADFDVPVGSFAF